MLLHRQTCLVLSANRIQTLTRIELTVSLAVPPIWTEEKERDQNL